MSEAPLQLVVLIGLPASGKTTFRKRHFAQGFAVVSKDLFPNNRRPARRQQQLLHDALASGRSVVIDNTNVTREARGELIALGHAYGARVVGYYFPPHVRDSLSRNQRRTGKARVPDVAIFAAAKRLQPPTAREGFDELHYVRIIGEDQFEVRAAKPD